MPLGRRERSGPSIGPSPIDSNRGHGGAVRSASRPDRVLDRSMNHQRPRRWILLRALTRQWPRRSGLPTCGHWREPCKNDNPEGIRRPDGTDIPFHHARGIVDAAGRRCRRLLRARASQEASDLGQRYHIREAGSTATSGGGCSTLAQRRASYVEACVAAAQDENAVGARLSFFFKTAHNNFPRGKWRSSARRRRLWARLDARK
jgi:hypothetical protein